MTYAGIRHFSTQALRRDCRETTDGQRRLGLAVLKRVDVSLGSEMERFVSAVNAGDDARDVDKGPIFDISDVLHSGWDNLRAK